jgi:hypothetical protein
MRQMLSVQMWQEVRDDEGQVVESEVGSLAQEADHRPFLVGRLPGQAARLGGAFQAVGNPSLAPLADGLGADTIAFGSKPGGSEERAISARTAGVVRAFG